MNLFPRKYTLLANERITMHVRGEELAEMAAWTPEQWNALIKEMREAARGAVVRSQIGASEVTIRKYSRRRASAIPAIKESD
jgi:hypothetical protein